MACGVRNCINPLFRGVGGILRGSAALSLKDYDLVKLEKWQTYQIPAVIQGAIRLYELLGGSGNLTEKRDIWRDDSLAGKSPVYAVTHGYRLGAADRGSLFATGMASFWPRQRSRQTWRRYAMAFSCDPPDQGGVGGY
jgi:hypothetical protein